MGAYDRRSVLLGGSALLGATLAACPREPDKGTHPADKPPVEGKPPEGELGVAEVMPVLVAIADRLLPADDLGPGAKAAGVETYFEKVLADPRMKQIRSVAVRGAVWITRAARKEHGKQFWELDDAQKDNFLTRLANNQVRPQGFTPQAFVRVMLSLTLEGFLCDPRHGGNKDQIGWKFVGGINWAGRTG